MVQQTICRDYGSFITTFLNANFTTAENAYNTFFVYYRLEGFNFIDEIKEKYSIEYTARYVSTKKFLDYYNKAFDNKIEENVAELTYKREYQRRITQVYRYDSIKKPLMRKDFKDWKLKAREQLKLYRENKITEEQFCTWIEENKN